MAERYVQRLAPHMIVGLGGPNLSEEECGLLSDYHFSGVILFDRNVQDARQIMEMTREIRRIFRERWGCIPVIAADHEGGIISVLGRAIGVPPTQMAAARTGDPRCCERLFAENARRLRACGVNMLLGPVADVNSECRNPVIGTRSFGEDVHLVSALVSSAVSTARKEGVLTCIKHFPGHGSSCLDSHVALPVLGATLVELKRNDIPPFASGIKAGAEAVMVGHVAPQGRGLPASLDEEIIGGLLRKELGFEGVVMTDALEMEGVKMAGPPADDAARGVSAARSLPEICRLALEAGNDILLFSKPAAVAIGELRALEEPAESDEFWGRAVQSFEQASMARIEKLLKIAADKDREFELPSDPRIYDEIAERSILLHRGRETASNLGVDKGGGAILDSAGGVTATFYSEKGELERFPARSFMARVLQGVRAFTDGGAGSGIPAGSGRSSLEPYAAIPRAAAGLEALRFSAGKPDAAIEAVFFMNRRPLSEEAVMEICSGARVAVIAGWPYAARFVPSSTAALVTYGIYDAAADAVCRRLAKK